MINRLRLKQTGYLDCGEGWLEIRQSEIRQRTAGPRLTLVRAGFYTAFNDQNASCSCRANLSDRSRGGPSHAEGMGGAD